MNRVFRESRLAFYPSGSGSSYSGARQVMYVWALRISVGVAVLLVVIGPCGESFLVEGAKVHEAGLEARASPA